MNQANVEALTELIRKIPIGFRDDPEDLAPRLAALGVLVPSTLTDDEVGAVRTCGYVLQGEIHQPGEPAVVRFVLEHIASGEPIPWVGEDYLVRLDSPARGES